MSYSKMAIEYEEFLKFETYIMNSVVYEMGLRVIRFHDKLNLEIITCKSLPRKDLKLFFSNVFKLGSISFGKHTVLGNFGEIEAVNMSALMYEFKFMYLSQNIQHVDIGTFYVEDGIIRLKFQYYK
jgi:hypothetical protein